MAKDILDILRERLADPSYIPTGPTYGEVVPASTEEEIRERIAKVNWLRATEQERERCAACAEQMVCVFDGPRLRSETWDLCKQAIANAIRKGE